MNMKFVSYCRCSTKEQGESKLGIEAQQRLNRNYIAQISGELLHEFIEVTSGTYKTRIKDSLDFNELLRKRPILREAIRFCEAQKATLVVKDLSRLMRSQLLTSYLIQRGVNFICVDSPSDSTFILGIKAALAEEEARQISERTSQALQSLKARGVKLGNLNNLHKGRILGAKERRLEAIEFYKPLNKRILRLKGEGKSLRYIARELNSDGVRTKQNKEFTAMTIKNILDRLNYC
jgi:DNA invertase Pin-like site-specific DNA recombinase